MNLQEKGERGLGQSSPLSSFYAIVLIDILHGAVSSLLMILVPCAVDDAHGIFSKGGLDSSRCNSALPSLRIS